jgi:predicted nuclease with TOPRIM domain
VDVAKLKAENEALKQEKERLEKQMNHLKKGVKHLEKDHAALEQAYAKVKFELNELQRLIFQSRSERYVPSEQHVPNQLSFDFGELDPH